MIRKIKYKDHIVWYLNGKKHREDGPAVEWNDGTKEWWLNDLWHREDGPAVEDRNGDKYWYINGKYHREDGPAYESFKGYKSWHINNCWINEIKLYLNKKFINCVGQFLYNKDRDYLILCFERDTHYFYMVLWERGLYVDIESRRYDCSLEELKSLL